PSPVFNAIVNNSWPLFCNGLPDVDVIVPSLMAQIRHMLFDAEDVDMLVRKSILLNLASLISYNTHFYAQLGVPNPAVIDLIESPNPAHKPIAAYYDPDQPWYVSKLKHHRFASIKRELRAVSSVAKKNKRFKIKWDISAQWPVGQ